MTSVAVWTASSTTDLFKFLTVLFTASLVITDAFQPNNDISSRRQLKSLWTTRPLPWTITSVTCSSSSGSIKKALSSYHRHDRNCHVLHVSSSSSSSSSQQRKQQEKEEAAYFAKNNIILDLGRRRDWKELLTYYQEEKKENFGFGNVNYATLMSQLGRIGSGKNGVNTRDTLFISFMDDLANKVETEGIREMGIREIVNIIYAIAKLNLKNDVASKRIINLVSKGNNAKWIVKAGNTQAVANTAWSFAKLNVKSSKDFFNELESWSEWLCDGGETYEISITAWSAGKLGMKEAACNLFKEIDDQAEWFIDNISKTQEISNIAWSAGKLGVNSELPNFFQAINAEAKWFVQEAKPQEISNVIWAGCGKLGYKMPSLLKQIDQRADWFVAHGNTQNIANTVWAISKAYGNRGQDSPRPTSIFFEIDKKAKKIIHNPKIKIIEISNIASSFAKMNIQSPTLFEEISSRGQWIIDQKNNMATKSIIWSYKQLDLAVPVIFNQAFAGTSASSTNRSSSNNEGKPEEGQDYLKTSSNSNNIWASKKVLELKEECRNRGLKVTGTKQELVERLSEWNPL